jgi:hypothetical protein
MQSGSQIYTRFQPHVKVEKRCLTLFVGIFELVSHWRIRNDRPAEAVGRMTLATLPQLSPMTSPPRPIFDLANTGTCFRQCLETLVNCSEPLIQLQSARILCVCVERQIDDGCIHGYGRAFAFWQGRWDEFNIWGVSDRPS